MGYRRWGNLSFASTSDHNLQPLEGMGKIFIRFAHQPTRDVPQECEQDLLFLQRAGYDEIDCVCPDRFQNCGRWIALVVMNRRIERQVHLPKRVLKLPRRLLKRLADVDHIQRRAEPFAHAFRLGQHMAKARRKGARDRNRSVSRFFH